jgi:hypothetical protein
MFLAGRAHVAGLPLLVVTNAELSAGIHELAQQLSQEFSPLITVTWNGQGDDPDLQAAIRQMNELLR